MDSILRASNLIDVEALLNDRRKPPPLTRQVGRGADTDDLECVAALARGEVVGLGGVHHLLRNLANRGGGARFPEGLPVQSSASPFGRFSGDHYCYFVCRGRSDLAHASALHTTVSVAFQSPLNGEVWWDPHETRRGVVSRPMARRFRSGEAAGRVHGYRGRQFTLIARGGGGLPTADKTVDVALVQVWRDHEHVPGEARVASMPAGPDTRSLKRPRDVSDADAAPWRRVADVPGELVVVREVVRFARDVPPGGTMQRAVLPPAAYEAWLAWHRRLVDGAPGAAGPPPPLPPPPPADSGQFRI